MVCTTPIGGRLNAEWDNIRAELARMNPERAELMRQEILIVLVLVKVEIQRWGRDKGARKASYREGAISDAVGADYDAIVEVGRLYSTDFTRLLT